MPDGVTITVVVQVLDLAAWAERFGPAEDLVAAIEDYVIATVRLSAAGTEGLLRVEQVGHARWRSPG